MAWTASFHIATTQPWQSSQAACSLAMYTLCYRPNGGRVPGPSSGVLDCKARLQRKMLFSGFFLNGQIGTEAVAKIKYLILLQTAAGMVSSHMICI
jgi:hypothetical protein